MKINRKQKAKPAYSGAQQPKGQFGGPHVYGVKVTTMLTGVYFLQGIIRGTAKKLQQQLFLRVKYIQQQTKTKQPQQKLQTQINNKKQPHKTKTKTKNKQNNSTNPAHKTTTKKQNKNTKIR